jgi:hypothetical protein
MASLTRDAKVIGDDRELPFLKDLFRRALERAEQGDLIIWTNDDNGLDVKIVDWAKGHLAEHSSASMRRPDEPGVHVGRDLFGFSREWLAANIDDMPDFICGAPLFDLVIAAMIRKTHGITSALQNMHHDIMPAECPARYVLHEAHKSSWAGANEHTLPANLHNRRLAHIWCANNMPTLNL